MKLTTKELNEIESFYSNGNSVTHCQNCGKELNTIVLFANYIVLCDKCTKQTYKDLELSEY